MLGANTESKLGPHHDDLRQVMSPVKHRDVGRLTSSVRSHYHHHPLHDKSQVIRLKTMPTAIGVFFQHFKIYSKRFSVLLRNETNPERLKTFFRRE